MNNNDTSKMGTLPRQVKGAIVADDWRVVYREFKDLTSEMTGEAIAALDNDLDQKIANRWKLGRIKREPSAPKMAAMRRVVALLKRTTPTEREMGMLEVLERVEGTANEFRRRLGLPEIPVSSRMWRVLGDDHLRHPPDPPIGGEGEVGGG